jgi:hypothetical protein
VSENRTFEQTEGAGILAGIAATLASPDAAAAHCGGRHSADASLLPARDLEMSSHSDSGFLVTGIPEVG